MSGDVNPAVSGVKDNGVGNILSAFQINGSGRNKVDVVSRRAAVGKDVNPAQSGH